MYFEEFKVGDCHTTARYTMTEQEIVAFGAQWDPQPFHIDAEASKHSIFGGLVASGLHTVLVTYRLFDQLQLWGPQALAGLGYRSIRFAAPVFPGDVLHATATVTETKPSTKLDRGVVTFHVSTRTEQDREVLRLELDILGRRRGAEGLDVSAPVEL